MEAQLTERQREVLERLERGMGAREIAEDLGVSRNAVYQQIQRLRRSGELDPAFTPTGQPPRESTPGAGTLARIIGADGHDGDAMAVTATLALLNEIRYTRDQLQSVVTRLSSLLPS